MRAGWRQHSDDERHLPFDVSRYAPKFTPEEEQAAREEGYFCAEERWEEHINTLKFEWGFENHKMKTRAAVAHDLEYAGTPPERLGALGQAANRLPFPPEYTEPDPQVPAGRIMREARIQGMRDRLAQLLHRLEAEDGLSREELPELDEDAWHRNPDVQHRLEERQAIAERLAAFGADPVGMEAGIDPNDDSYSEPWIPDEDLPARDPELARVFEAFDADKARYEAGEHGWWNEMDKQSEEEDANSGAW